MFFAYPGGSGECEMNMHVALRQDQQLAEPAGAVKLTVLTVSLKKTQKKRHISLSLDVSDAAW